MAFPQSTCRDASPETFHDAFDVQAASMPEAACVVSRGTPRQVMSYARVRKRSIELAAGLLESRRALNSRVSAGQNVGIRDKLVAVWLSRAHADFVPLLLAISRIGSSFVLLSTDLPEKALEEQRNSMILNMLQPSLCVVGAASDSTHGGTAFVSIDALSTHGAALPLGEGETLTALEEGCQKHDPLPILCYMFTGGTQRTKVVQVTHAMILHERTAYRELWQPQSPAIVLAHTSVYWGASALGQLSIALAFGGTVVWSEATEPRDLQQCVRDEGVTVLGVVPDHLDLLAPQAPAEELPTVECIFTWGERLPQRLVEKWRSHKVVLRELLIATEYWLALYADPFADGTLRSVRDAKLLVLKDDGNAAESGEIGELCIAGPMVMAGYLAMDNGQGEPPDVFFSPGSNSPRYFRTRDLVRCTPGGVVYKGRADMMAKDKGKWIDMLALEESTSKLDGVHELKLVPDPSQEHYHLFVVFKDGFLPGIVLNSLRLLMPPWVQLWIVPSLPRHPVTRKVDTKRLLENLGSPPISWPVYGTYTTSPSPPAKLVKRFQNRFQAHFTWTLVALLSSCFVANTQASVAKRRLVKIAWRGLSLLALPYAWLAMVYVDDAEFAESYPILPVLRTIMLEFPFGKLGTFVFSSIASLMLRWPFSEPFRAWLLGSIIWGMHLAARRRRLLAWPVLYWTIGSGMQLDNDIGGWLRPEAWRWCAEQQRSRMHRLALAVYSKCKGSLVSAPKQIEKNTTSAHSASTCYRCEKDFIYKSWCSTDADGNKLCDTCGVAMVSAAETEALQVIEGRIAAKMQHETPTGVKTPEPNSPPKCEDTPPKCESDAATEDVAGEAPTESKGAETDSNKVDAKDGSEEQNGSSKGKEKPSSNEQWLAQQRRRYDTWWWYNCTHDTFDMSSTEEKQTLHSLQQGYDHDDAPACVTTECDTSLHEAQQVFAAIALVEPRLRPVHAGTILIGMDSLRVARLANAIKAQLGRLLTIGQLRRVKSAAELVTVVLQADAVKGDSPSSDVPADLKRDYIIWFTPGQVSGMGQWVMCSDRRIDVPALQQAVRKLTDRHSALRAECAEPLRYMSFVDYCSVLWTLLSPFLDKSGSNIARVLMRVISWSFQACWARTRCFTKEKLYGSKYPELNAPFEIVKVRGQTEFEQKLVDGRAELELPYSVTLVEMDASLADVWNYKVGKDHGQFVIVQRPKTEEDAIGLAYVDASSNEWGPLVSSVSDQWESPPHSFPAIFFVPLTSGSALWLRLESADELRIVYRYGPERTCKHFHLVAFRAAPHRVRSPDCETTVQSLLCVCLLHSFGDGNCFMPVYQDMLALYEAERGNQPTPQLQGAQSFEVLERRLLDAIWVRTESPDRTSFRGTTFKYHGRGYGYGFDIQPGMAIPLRRVCELYRVPFDITILGLVACAIARADRHNLVEFTVFVPMRDGLAEVSMVGLFSDWRDLTVSVDFDMATVLGTVLQLNHTIQNRQWQVFNPLRKPDRTVVNMQLLDTDRRSHFRAINEGLFWGGDRFERARRNGRDDRLQGAKQPVNFNLEQKDEHQWWIGFTIGIEERPPAWTRRLAAALRESFQDFLFNPLSKVHKKLPDTDLPLWLQKQMEDKDR